MSVLLGLLDGVDNTHLERTPPRLQFQTKLSSRNHVSGPRVLRWCVCLRTSGWHSETASALCGACTDDVQPASGRGLALEGDPPRADPAACPVAARIPLGADHAARARRVHELAAAKRDPDVRCAARHGLEEHQIAGPDLVALDLFPDEILLPHLARKREPLLREDPLDESAAIESRRIAAAVAVRRSLQRERERDDGRMNGAFTGQRLRRWKRWCRPRRHGSSRKGPRGCDRRTSGGAAGGEGNSHNHGGQRQGGWAHQLFYRPKLLRYLPFTASAP